MPERSTNVRPLIRQMTLEGKSASEILSAVQAQSAKPENWKLTYIEKLMQTYLSIASPSTSSTHRNGTFTLDENKGWGVEIEMFIPCSEEDLIQKLVGRGIAIRGHGYNHRVTLEWKIVSDGSLRNNSLPSHYHACELVSPILKGQAGEAELKKVCEVLEIIGARVNSSCGLHVHQGCSPVPGTQFYSTSLETKREIRKAIRTGVYAACIYHHFQKIFDNMIPKHRVDCEYARHFTLAEINALKESKCKINHIETNFSEDSSRGRRSNRMVYPSRRKVVNLSAFWRHGTIEFRQHSGSTEFQKIISWVKITQAIMLKAEKLAKTNVDIFNYNFNMLSTELELGDLIGHIKERVQKFNPEVLSEVA